MATVEAPNIQLTDQDNTATQGFEKAGRNVVAIQPWECGHCRQGFGEKGRDSAKIKVMTARGPDEWCMDCFRKGVKEGICIKEEKPLSKKERNKLKKLNRNN